MEKVYKLLNSKNIDDNKIGLHLLLNLPAEQILEFFNSYKNYEGNGVIDVKLNDRLFKDKTYIKITDQYFITSFKDGDLRLRSLGSPGWGDEWKIITIEQFTNGVY